ncbi:DNA-directed DNA polymerase [Halocatena halophila]|uniref:DNA-directed DNA polymerase n=1 Tax=Halocatena halophila TaxID=2814576 RepID=UPI002ED66608
MSTEEFLVTKVEASCEDGTDIHLFGRDNDNERKEVVVEDYSPFFFVPKSEIGDVHSLIGSNGIISIEESDRDGFCTDCELMKVTVEEPRNIRSAKKLFHQTFGADVSVENRFRIETGLKDAIAVDGKLLDSGFTSKSSPDNINPVEGDFPDVTPRVCTLDIEVDDRGEFPEAGERRITSIVAHDSFEDEIVGFIDLDGREVNEAFPEGKPEEVDKLHFEPDERRMLIRFACWVSEHNPDILTGWNMDDFDAPYIITRMEKIGVNPDRLSPLADAGLNYKGNAEVAGRSVYDILEAYKKNSWGNLRSYSLNYVANEELGESKIEHDRGFYELWQEDPTKFINYNARDTDLTVRINEKGDVIGFRDTLRKQVGINFEDTLNSSDFIEMMVRRKLKERGEVAPTADPEDAEGYEGAYVFEPYNGVAENVVCIDIDSLYPWTMYMLNASPEMKTSLNDAEEHMYDENGNAKPGYASFAPNGVSFSLEKVGLFKSIVEEAINLKREFDELKSEAAANGNDELYKKYDIQYMAAKVIVNSIYGVIGWDRFVLYDRETAEAITLAGQKVIKATAEFVENETEGTVVYGDTDSNYIKFPSEWDQQQCVEYAHKICDRLETEVYPDVAEGMGIPAEECRWTLGPEMYTPRFFQYGKKKKYAYRATWKEGMDMDDVVADPKTTIKGSAAKRSDASRLTRDTEKGCIKAILDGEPGRCNEIVHEAALKLDPDDPDWETIGIPSGIGKALDNYETDMPRVRGARYSNELLGTNYGNGDKPMRCYIQPFYSEAVDEEIDVIGYEDGSDLQPILDDITIDAGKMTQTLIVNPLENILDSVGVDINAALKGQHQNSLEAYF